MFANLTKILGNLRGKKVQTSSCEQHRHWIEENQDTYVATSNLSKKVNDLLANK